jgi:type I restriction enzyme M protein
LISGIGLGSQADRSRDVLGRVYEYFLGRFAAAEGRNAGEFYTPRSVVRVLVEMLEPYKGRIYDPCCGVGGMFVQSEEFVRAHAGRINDLSIIGQESNHTTWKLAKMNLAIRGFDGDLGPHNDDTFRNDLHKQLKAEYIIANPPFNISDWGGEQLQEDVRWKFGAPRPNNANYAWIQHFIHHLHPSRGTAGFVLANGAMSSSTGTDGAIRQAIVDKDYVDCMVALPPQLFYTTQIPVCLWFLTTSKRQKGHRARRGETLFIDARGMGEMKTRVLRELTEEEIARIAGTYHAWRNADGDYEDLAGFCRSVTTEEIGTHDYVLTPGRYVGSEAAEVDDEPFADKLERLQAQLFEQFDRSRELEQQIRDNFTRLVHD